MKDPAELAWLQLEDHMYWMNNEATGIRIGEQVTTAGAKEADDGYNAFKFDSSV